MIVQHGRYGPYIAFNKENYKIPKGTIPEELTLENVRKIINETDPSKSKTRAKVGAKTKAASKASEKKTKTAKTTKTAASKKPAAKAKTTTKKPTTTVKKVKE